MVAVTGKGGKEFEPQDLMGHHFFVRADLTRVSDHAAY